MLPQQVQDAVRQGVEPETGFVEQLGGIGVGVGQCRHVQVAAVHFPLVGVYPHPPVDSEWNVPVICARGRALQGGAESADPRLPVEPLKRRAHRFAVAR